MKNKKGFVLSILFVFFILGVSLPLFMINHKKVKADTISDLTGTTWVINDSPSIPSRSFYYLNYTSKSYNFTRLGFRYEDGWSTAGNTIFYWSSNDEFVVYDDGFLDTDFKTIEITGGSDVTNSTLISWLQNNATQQVAPHGTEIIHKYWASYLDIVMTDNEIVGDNSITYKVLYNQYDNNYSDVTLTGLAFTGKLTSINDNYSYIYSTYNNDTLYKGNTNTIDNVLWLEFTVGDYIDDDLYDLMYERGVWFDDASVYLAGTNLGSVYGFNRGLAQGQADGLQYTNVVTGIFNGLGNVLSIQVFPNITIALLIGLPLLLGVFIIIIKILRG